MDRLLHKQTRFACTSIRTTQMETNQPISFLSPSVYGASGVKFMLA